MAHSTQWLNQLRCCAMALIPALLLCACAEKNDDHEGHEGHDMTAHVDAPSDPATTSAAAHASGQPLVDIDGVQHGTLAAPASGKWTSLFFVRTDCPISNQYAPEIKRICTEYGPQGLQCLMVYADTHDNIEAVRRHRSEFGYSLPAILDPGHALVAQAGAHLRRVVKLEAMAAQRYVKYIREAIEIRTQMGQSLISEICLDRDNLAAPEALATALNSMMPRLEAREVELVKQSESVLGQADKRLVDTYVATTVLPSITVTRTDFHKFMETPGQTPEVILNRMCNR